MLIKYSSNTLYLVSQMIPFFISCFAETRSHYELESGFFMKSFTATIFVASLVTLGVLLITLVISLVIMLQSCQSKSAGVIELLNIKDYYSYCRLYSLHAALNNLEGYNLPTTCRNLGVQYIKGGQYARELDLTMSVIDDYFKNVKPLEDGLDVVLMDIDDIFPWNHSSNLFHRFYNDSTSNCIKEANNVKLMFVLRLYMYLQTGGWSIILLSREPRTYRNVTINHLVSAGFRSWSALIMRAEDSDPTKGYEYFCGQRNVVRKKGFRIKSIISSHMDAVTVRETGERNFLLPDPLCDKFVREHRY
ncbi:uncharacterized protein HKW66_Vig0055350 [Vigna angularis]|uniref:Acid phosphatase n=2 Tax=Phaseolus angularis TaxID=3914 RepID=A0A8T0L341_PHAAN|nr:uncharacterized protein At2g39920 isoform X1 [Vigna angularis]KAG2406279.1 uncharacterized protein HKW66_Vig0055350 [Vigna angularis]BAT85957.1 hypothetical protein VIGAN_04356100 [Vigna angularis var. angularis]